MVSFWEVITFLGGILSNQNNVIVYGLGGFKGDATRRPAKGLLVAGRDTRYDLKIRTKRADPMVVAQLFEENPIPATGGPKNPREGSRLSKNGSKNSPQREESPPICLYLSIYLSIYLCVYLCVYIYIYMYISIYICVYGQLEMPGKWILSGLLRKCMFKHVSY